MKTDINITFFAGIGQARVAVVLAGPDILLEDVMNCSNDLLDLGFKTEELPKKLGLYKIKAVMHTYYTGPEESYDVEYEILSIELIHAIDLNQVEGPTYKEMGFE